MMTNVFFNKDNSPCVQSLTRSQFYQQVQNIIFSFIFIVTVC